MALAEKYRGRDNHGRLKTEYLEKVDTMTEDELLKECESKIWLSAFAGNDPRSDYHWQVDYCYDRCKEIERPDIYSNAYEAVKQTI